MKKIIIILGLFLVLITAKSQQVSQDSINLNMLNALSNPAFNLMGISTSAIERPTDLNAFKLSVQNATNNFTKLPNNYAIEISPAALFNMSGQTLDKFQKKYIPFWQTLSVSVGVTKSDEEDKETDDATSFTKLGFGLKFSFIRPKWTDSTKFYYDDLISKQSIVLNVFEEMKKNNTALNEIDDKITKANGDTALLRTLIEEKSKLTHIHDSTVLEEQPKNAALFLASKNLKESAQKFKIERKGPFLDFASGLVLDFPDNRFNYSLVGKAGAWLTGGYEGGNHFSFLAIGRYLYQPDKIFADDSGTLSSKNISTFDMGAKIAVSGMQGKFAFSTEYIRRTVLTKNVIDPSWRLVFNTEYDVGFNQKLTLAIGRNFDRTITKDGNIIAALNFIKGFGSNKKINSPKSPN